MEKKTHTTKLSYTKINKINKYIRNCPAYSNLCVLAIEVALALGSHNDLSCPERNPVADINNQVDCSQSYTSGA